MIVSPSSSLCTPTDSPVMLAWSTRTPKPRSSRPSAGSLSPGPKATRSPTATAEAQASTPAPPRTSATRKSSLSAASAVNSAALDQFCTEFMPETRAITASIISACSTSSVSRW